MTTGEKLRVLREKTGLTQNEVAAKCGVTQSALNQYENDKRVPRDSIKIALACFYRVSVQALFFSA